jgi:hypothetical protein
MGDDTLPERSSGLRARAGEPLSPRTNRREIWNSASFSAFNYIEANKETLR